jgi:hypothetical protein
MVVACYSGGGATALSNCCIGVTAGKEDNVRVVQLLLGGGD